MIQRAIEADKANGISSRFLDFIRSLDKKAGEAVAGPEKTLSGKAHEVVDPLVASVVGKTKEVDQNRGISKQASDIYSRGLATDIGKKVWSFYTETTKQVADVHNEARRIANVSTDPIKVLPEEMAIVGPTSLALSPHPYCIRLSDV